jgi:hypothetical protein
MNNYCYTYTVYYFSISLFLSHWLEPEIARAPIGRHKIRTKRTGSNSQANIVIYLGMARTAGLLCWSYQSVVPHLPL